MTILFNLLAVFYIFRSLQIARIVWQNWGTIRDESFTPVQKSLAEQASFFLAVPVAVFFHELAHALVVWAFGGRVVEFGYRVFWGFVVPEGIFTPAQDWFIALAGTLGSLLFGLGLWLGLRRHNSPTIRYFGLRSFRYQIFFSIIYYPLFTLLGFYGDWRTIYDFGETPILSGATAAVHAVMLGAFLWANQRGWFEMPAFQSEVDKERLTSLEADAVVNPQDAEQQLKLIDAYRRSGATRQAEQHLKAFLKQHPNSAAGHLQMALLLAQGKNRVSPKARDSAKRAISLGLNRPVQVALANQLLGQYSLGVDRIDEAVQYFDQAVLATRSIEDPAMRAQSYYLRALANRRQGNYDRAYGDIQEAIALARGANQGGLMSQYQLELETIKNHSGRR